MGWVAAGILRVWATIQRSEYTSQFKSESDELVSWAKEIMDDVIKYQVSDLECGVRAGLTCLGRRREG